ncbi:MAG: MMPL family transporter [Myxococcales bacterium]|nr:MMPL family transporter [Myxococcales bacterium]
MGESRPGTPILYPESDFNVAAQVIGDRFFGLDELLLIAHSDTVRRLYAPDALKFIDATQRVLEMDPSAGGSLSMLDVFKETNRRFHNNDPRWAINFQTTAEISGFLYVIENSVPAQGVLNRFRDYDGQSLSIRVFYRDHRASTIGRMNRVLRDFSETERLEGGLAVRLRRPERSGLRRWLGELLPPPTPSLEVTAAETDGARHQLQVDRSAGLARGAVAYWEEKRSARSPETARGGLFGHRVVEGKLGRAAEIRQTGARGEYQLWVRRHDQAKWELRPNGVWLPEGVELRLAAGTMGVLAAANEEIAKSHRAALIVVIAVTFVIIAVSYRSFTVGVLLTLSLAVAALTALAVQGIAGIGLNVNTLPVQAIGIGIGVDYGIYVVDRARKEMRRGLERDAAIGKAVETTGIAVVFTASTLLAGIVLWIPLSSLRFSADMSLLLSVLMALNAIGAVLFVPAMLRLLPRSWISESVPGFR